MRSPTLRLRTSISALLALSVGTTGPLPVAVTCRAARRGLSNAGHVLAELWQQRNQPRADLPKSGRRLRLQRLGQHFVEQIAERFDVFVGRILLGFGLRKAFVEFMVNAVQNLLLF